MRSGAASQAASVGGFHMLRKPINIEIQKSLPTSLSRDPDCERPWMFVCHAGSYVATRTRTHGMLTTESPSLTSEDFVEPHDSPSLTASPGSSYHSGQQDWQEGPNSPHILLTGKSEDGLWVHAGTPASGPTPQG